MGARISYRLEALMSEWLAFAQWAQCREMARPGIIFEIQNGEGQSLFTPCVVPLVEVPFDWRSPPVRFRAIPEPAPQRSVPLPGPRT
jgi:hypothetical protein